MLRLTFLVWKLNSLHKIILSLFLYFAQYPRLSIFRGQRLNFSFPPIFFYALFLTSKSQNLCFFLYSDLPGKIWWNSWPNESNDYMQLVRFTGSIEMLLKLCSEFKWVFPFSGYFPTWFSFMLEIFKVFFNKFLISLEKLSHYLTCFTTLSKFSLFFWIHSLNYPKFSLLPNFQYFLKFLLFSWVFHYYCEHFP